MVVNQDHYINGIFHEPGQHAVTVEQFDTPWACIAARILVDPADADDVAAVNKLQDQLAIDATSAKPLAMTGYDTASLDETRNLLLGLAKGLKAFDHSFGAKSDVNPVRHLIATAAGWGGLPDPGSLLHRRRTEAADRRVRADGARCTGGRVLVNLGLQRRRVLRTERPQRLQHQQHHGDPERRRLRHRPLWWRARPASHDPDLDGWNYLVRLYRPRAEILDGSWRFPSIDRSDERGIPSGTFPEHRPSPGSMGAHGAS